MASPGTHIKFTAVIMLALLAVSIMAQSGNRPHANASGGVQVGVIARRDDNRSSPITSKDVAIFDNGAEQSIRNFTPDPSPARIVLLVDNSLSIRADVEKLEQAAREFAYEIFEGDKLLIVGYDEQAEIVSDWTDDAKAIEASLKLFRKKGQPHLFDAIRAVVEEALRPLPSQKRIIIVISDGLDRGSKATFEQTLAELQAENIMVYAVQAVDRTRGAIRRDVPKPKVVIDKLAEGTGGQIFSIDEPQLAAKAICDELRKNRYTLLCSFKRAFRHAAGIAGRGKPGNHRESEVNAAAKLAFLARVQIKKPRHYQQDQQFHEDEEPENERAIFEERVRISYVGSNDQATEDPYYLPFSIPPRHYFSFNNPDSQCITFNAYCLLSLPGTFIPIGRLFAPAICAESIAASPWITTRPLPCLKASA
jgi:VWFA-related protein